MSRRPVTPVALSLATLLVLTSAMSTSIIEPWVYPATVTVQTEAFAVRDLSGALLRSQAWRVVDGTGNCCENHITVTPDGRILDVGGDTILVTSDEGLRWQVVDPFFQWTGEGSLTVAPNGDVVGVIWQPYSGDLLWAVKQFAATGQWGAQPVALHRPFFDRPWVSVAQGPFQVGTTTYPYAVLVTPGALGAEGATLVSFDGWHYAPAARHPDLTLPGGVPSAPLSQPAVAWADWVQPVGHSLIAPLPSGGALAAIGCPWDRLNLDLTWTCATPTGLVPNDHTIVRFDSLGRTHVLQVNPIVERLTYRILDVGASQWRTAAVLRLAGDLIDTGGVDFVVSGVHDVANIVAQHRVNSTDRIEVYRLKTLSAPTPTVEVLQVGLGDRTLGGSLGGTDRFDFATIGMLPDGRVVTSFADSRHHPPALAIELPDQNG